MSKTFNTVKVVKSSDISFSFIFHGNKFIYLAFGIYICFVYLRGTVHIKGHQQKRCKQARFQKTAPDMGQYTDIEVSPVTSCTHCSGVFHHTGCDITITREKCVFPDCLAVVLEVTGFHWVKSVTKKVLHQKPPPDCVDYYLVACSFPRLSSNIC